MVQLRGAFAEVIYERPAEAIAWLERAFGLRAARVVTAEDGAVVFAELRAGPGVVLLRPPEHPGEHNPRTLGGGSQQLYVPVDQPDEHYRTALANDAVIVLAPTDTSFGARMYSARDPEGHLWTFGTYQVDG